MLAGAPCEGSMWPTLQGEKCRRCGDAAVHHDHYTASTSCSACYRCPAFAGAVAAFVHAVTRWWP